MPKLSDKEIISIGRSYGLSIVDAKLWLKLLKKFGHDYSVVQQIGKPDAHGMEWLDHILTRRMFFVADVDTMLTIYLYYGRQKFLKEFFNVHKRQGWSNVAIQEKLMRYGIPLG